MRGCLIFLSSMSFKRTVRENSKVHNFLPNLYNNPSTFSKFLGLYFDAFLKNHTCTTSWCTFLSFTLNCVCTRPHFFFYLFLNFLDFDKIFFFFSISTFLSWAIHDYCTAGGTLKRQDTILQGSLFSTTSLLQICTV